MTRDTFQAKGDPRPEPVPQHPIQPLYMDNAVIRFKENGIVRKLVDKCRDAGYSLNEIVCDPETTREDLVQLYQLIGYSLHGYGELQAVTNVDYEAAEAMLGDEDLTSAQARIEVLESTLEGLRVTFKPSVAALYGIHEDDLSHGRP